MRTGLGEAAQGSEGAALVAERDADRRCTAGCAQCRTEDGEGSVLRTGGHIPLEGWRLAGGALGVFGAPVLLALGGAALGGDSAALQAAGAFAGLAVGAGAAGIAARLLRAKDEEGAWVQH